MPSWRCPRPAAKFPAPDTRAADADRPQPVVNQVGARPHIDLNYGKLRLSFEPNRGQADKRVRFLSRGPGYSLFLTPTEAFLALQRPGKKRLDRAIPRAVGNLTPPAVAKSAFRGLAARAAEGPEVSILRVRLVGANRNPQIDGIEPLPGRANYFLGKDPKHWRTNIPTYAGVRLRNVYAGIDQLYYGANQSQLEYDFVLARNANPDVIRLRFEGADHLRFNDQGDLVLALAGGEVIHHAPLIYQDHGGRRQRVYGKCVLTGRNTVGFRVAAYDRSRPLFIDPGLVYSTYLGGSIDDWGSGIAVDASGNAYVTGFARSPNFPTTSGALQTALGGSGASDAFVTKLNPSGMALLYSTYLGGGGGDGGSGIAVDGSGNAYVTGSTDSTDFPTTPGAFQTTLGSPDASNAFVTKLNASGTALLYSTYLGGGGDPGSGTGDSGSGVAVDGAGDAYVTGSTHSTNFPITPGAFQTAFGGRGNAFVTKLNASGSTLLYSTYLGGSGFYVEGDQIGDVASGIAVDASGNAYVTGVTGSADFPTTPGTFQARLGGPVGVSNAFVTKLNAGGTALLYSTYLGGDNLRPKRRSSTSTATRVGTTN